MQRSISLAGVTDVLLIRPSAEIFLKSEGVRRSWEKILYTEIKKAIGEVKLRKGRGRIWIENEISPEAEERLKLIFGIQSFSRCERCDLNELEVKVLDFWNRRGNKADFTFAVRVKRTGSHEFTSQEMAAKIGALILDHHPDLKVNLDNPDYIIYIEIRDRDCYIFDEVIEGAGGLPYGVEGKVVALFSGGVDSSLACWLMMQRGSVIIPVYFDLGVFAGGEGVKRAEKVASFLQLYQRDFKPVKIDHGVFLSEVKRVLKEARLDNYRCLFCKREMYRVAEKIAAREGCKGIVTGESLGQVASQTLDNLFVLDQAVDIPVFRPLIGLDKMEIERLARKVGVYEICISIKEECLAIPEKPITSGNLKKILDLESALID